MSELDLPAKFARHGPTWAAECLTVGYAQIRSFLIESALQARLHSQLSGDPKRGLTLSGEAAQTENSTRLQKGQTPF
ncbi:MAG: hypothetical protein ACF788_13635 [Novipirellula sp. JB048]